jgi:hypothetical protein
MNPKRNPGADKKNAGYNECNFFLKINNSGFSVSRSKLTPAIR